MDRRSILLKSEEAKVGVRILTRDLKGGCHGSGGQEYEGYKAERHGYIAMQRNFILYLDCRIVCSQGSEENLDFFYRQIVQKFNNFFELEIDIQYACQFSGLVFERYGRSHNKLAGIF